MQISLENRVIQLAQGEVLAFRGARNVHLECMDGMVWLTIERQDGDFLLSNGKRLHIQSNGLALIQGLSSCSFRLVSLMKRPICQRRRFASFGFVRL